MNYSDNENSSDFYSEIPDGHLGTSDNEPVSFRHVPAVKQLIVTNIFPEEMPGMTMRMVSLPDKSGVKAEPASEYDKRELIEESSQIDAFIERMLETGRPFAIENKHTKACVRISMIKPNDIASSREGVLRTLTRKRTSGTGRPLDK